MGKPETRDPTEIQTMCELSIDAETVKHNDESWDEGAAKSFVNVRSGEVVIQLEWMSLKGAGSNGWQAGGGKQGAQTASSPSVLVKKILREQFKDAGKKYQRKHRRKKSQVIQGKGKLKKKEI